MISDSPGNYEGLATPLPHAYIEHVHKKAIHEVQAAINLWLVKFKVQHNIYH